MDECSFCWTWMRVAGYGIAHEEYHRAVRRALEDAAIQTLLPQITAAIANL